MNATWNREEIPYDAMGDYSAFHFIKKKEEQECEDRDRNENRQADKK